MTNKEKEVFLILKGFTWHTLNFDGSGSGSGWKEPKHLRCSGLIYLLSTKAAFKMAIENWTYIEYLKYAESKTKN